VTTVASDPGPKPKQASLLPIFLIVLVDVLGLTIVLPLLPVYGETFGASAFVAALLVPVYSACQLFSGPYLGSLSDRLGRVIDGLTAGNLSVAQAYIADNTAAENRARSFALIGIAFGIGFLLGPAITGLLSHYGMSVPLYLAAALSLTSIICTRTLLPPDPESKALRHVPTGAVAVSEAGPPLAQRLSVLSWNRYAAYLKRPVLGGVLLEFFLYQFAFAMFIGGFALFAERRYSWNGHAFGPREIGFVYAFSGLVGIIFQGGFMGRAVKVFRERRLIAMGLVALGLGYILMPYVEPVWPLLFAITLASLGNSVLRPSLTSIVTQVVDRKEQGMVLGLTQSLASLASITAAPLSGWLIDRRLLTAWGWVAAAFCALALCVRGWGSGMHADTPVAARGAES
jgi:DHA1 family tetracycline resistance protein-like MFS transporter